MLATQAGNEQANGLPNRGSERTCRSCESSRQARKVEISGEDHWLDGRFRIDRATELAVVVPTVAGIAWGLLASAAIRHSGYHEPPSSIQRFVAAHTLGHHRLGYETSLDDEVSIRESGRPDAPRPRLREIEANAFAEGCLLPTWRVRWQTMHYDREVKQIEDPSIVYELSPRLGTSFGGTWRALLGCDLITRPWMRDRLHPTRPLLLFGPTRGAFLVSLLVPALSVRLRTRKIHSHLRTTHRSQLT